MDRAESPTDVHASLLDRQHSLLLDEADADADAFALDHRAADSGDMAQDDFRRDSVNNTAALTPSSDGKWDATHASHPVDLHQRTAFAANNPFRHDYLSDSPYPHFSTSAPNASSLIHHSAWPVDHSATASPLGLEPFSMPGEEYEVPDYHHRVPDNVSSTLSPLHLTASTPFSPVNANANVGPSRTDDQAMQSPRSSSSEWMNLAAKDAQSRALPRHMRPASRAARTAAPRPAPSRAASDGVRKKNSRIDIPAERNLGNIEELIERADDEEEVKELKAQRRLLRNREAALASRQRKKQHTEELEHKEQRYVKQINLIKNDLTEMAQRHAKLEHDYRILYQKHNDTCNYVNGLNMEKEELIMKHTDETGILRRRIQHLTDMLEHPNQHDYPSSTNTSALVNTNFHDFTSGMNALSVNAQAWNPNAAPQTHPQPQPQASQQDVKAAKREQDPPVASGVLFMLLLCGAYVASRGNTKPFLPQMPEEVRVASDTVLESLLKDPRSDMLSGQIHPSTVLPQHQNVHVMAQSTNPWEPQPSGPHDPRQNLYRSLTMPSSQQEAEQIFALTPSEHRSLTSPETYNAFHPQHTMTPRRNLAETLASVREENINKAPPAEVFTRSLLWDQIPVDVVKQFKELVRQSDNEHLQQGVVTKAENMEDSTWHFGMPA